MKGLIIGGAGFVGGYLAKHLIDKGYNISVTKIHGTDFNYEGVNVFDLDILNYNQVENVINETKTDVIFHLAAQSSVALSWKEPKVTVDVNINGTLNILDAVRKLSIQPKILLIGSGEEYGIVANHNSAITEDTLLNPMNIYAATKACQGMIGKIYSKAYGLDIVMTRSFNHVGPGQSSQFVVSDFCRQVAEIEKGIKPPVIRVGNLSAKRDFTDVRDVAVAYRLLAERGKAGNIYNVGSGKATVIKDILDKIISMSSTHINVEIDPAKLRPVDVPVIEADILKLKADTGWQPTIQLEQTIRDTLDYWRENL